MKRLQTFQFELMPSAEEQRDMVGFSESCRFVFHKELALETDLVGAINILIWSDLSISAHQ